jgi:hypothetical protein
MSPLYDYIRLYFVQLLVTLALVILALLLGFQLVASAHSASFESWSQLGFTNSFQIALAVVELILFFNCFDSDNTDFQSSLVITMSFKELQSADSTIQLSGVDFPKPFFWRRISKSDKARSRLSFSVAAKAALCNIFPPNLRKDQKY